MTLALSSWAVDPLLSARYPDGPASGRGARQETKGALDILDLPAEAARHGFRRLEVCHFHLPPEPAARAEFARRALDAETVLQTLLIDDGDVTDPEHGARDEAWIARWLAVAEEMGFERARVIAGKQPSSESGLARSAEALKRLAGGTRARVATENWFSLLDSPEAVLSLLDGSDGRVGLCADFGNWPDAVADAGLPRILPRAETIHAKADYSDGGELETEAFGKKLRQARAAGFEGPYVLVAAARNDVWGSLRETARFVVETAR